MKINIIKACSDLGLTMNGTDKGPIEIYKNLDQNKINNTYTINKKDIKKSEDPLDLKKNLDGVNDVNERLYNAINKTIEEDAFPLTLGGDHAIAIGSALGSRKHNNIGLIWLDAHLDYNTFKTTITGNLHGLPLAALNGICKPLTEFYDGDFYNPLNTIAVGYRAQEENKEIEFNNTKEMGVTVLDSDYIKENGIRKAVEEAIKIACKNTDGVHVSFDMDFIDPMIAKGVSVPEKNGINLEQVNTILDVLEENIDKIKSFDLVEYNSDNDSDGKTIEIAKIIANRIIDAKRAK